MKWIFFHKKNNKKVQKIVRGIHSQTEQTGCKLTDNGVLTNQLNYMIVYSQVSPQSMIFNCNGHENTRMASLQFPSCYFLCQKSGKCDPKWLHPWETTSMSKGQNCWKQHFFSCEYCMLFTLGLHQNIIKCRCIYVMHWLTVLSYIPAKPLHNHDIVSVHFNHFYCMDICDKLRRDLWMTAN